MTLGELFNFCQDIELRQAKLYASFSLLLGSIDERIARFWEQMSTEEWQHYILVDFGHSLCTDAFGSDTSVADLADIPIQQIRGALDTHEQKVKSGVLSLDEAFEIAIAIEGSEVDTLYIHLLSIMREAIQLSDQPYLIDRIVHVEKGMMSHIDRLIQATQKFAKDTTVIRKAHRLKTEQR